jgi:hypothetical protein
MPSPVRVRRSQRGHDHERCFLPAFPALTADCAMVNVLAIEPHHGKGHD